MNNWKHERLSCIWHANKCFSLFCCLNQEVKGQARLQNTDPCSPEGLRVLLEDTIFDISLFGRRFYPKRLTKHKRFDAAGELEIRTKCWICSVSGRSGEGVPELVRHARVFEVLGEEVLSQNEVLWIERYPLLLKPPAAPSTSRQPRGGRWAAEWL